MGFHLSLSLHIPTTAYILLYEFEGYYYTFYEVDGARVIISSSDGAVLQVLFAIYIVISNYSAIIISNLTRGLCLSYLTWYSL